MNRKHKMLLYLISGAAALIMFSKMIDLNEFLDTLFKKSACKSCWQDFDSSS